MRILQKSDLVPGAHLRDYLYVDEDFIVLAKYTTVSQQDVNRIERNDLLRVMEETGQEENRAKRGKVEVYPEPPQRKGGKKAPVPVCYDSVLELLHQEVSNLTNRGSFNVELIERIASNIQVYVSAEREDAFARIARGCESMKTVKHFLHTGILTALLCMAMNIRGKELLHTVSGALLHDVGLFLLRDRVQETRKGIAPYDVRGSHSSLHLHPVLGYRLLLRMGISEQLVITPALQHHEKAGGNGYPEGINLEEMSSASRIVALCDNWDNQVNLIKFGNSISIHYSKKEFLAWKAEDYDRSLFEVFFQLLGSRSKKGETVLLSNGRRAEIRQTFLRFPLNPIVQVKRRGAQELIDLRKEKDLWIAGIG